MFPGRRLLPLPVILLLASGMDAAFAQHHGGDRAREHAPAARMSGDEAGGPFRVRSFGTYLNMIGRRDYAPRVALSEIEKLGATEAVGAVSGLRGEITIIGGRTVVSYGGCDGCPPVHAETATFLGIGKVAEWAAPIPIPADLSGHALDDFILTQAKEASLDLSKSFPVRLRGTLIGVEMHVVEAPNPDFTGHGSGMPMAKQDEYRHASLVGDVVGLYAPRERQGELTHPGEFFHFHWVNAERTRTAHIDAFGMRKGAELILPKR